MQLVFYIFCAAIFFLIVPAMFIPIFIVAVVLVAVALIDGMQILGRKDKEGSIKPEDSPNFQKFLAIFRAHHRIFLRKRKQLIVYDDYGVADMSEYAKELTYFINTIVLGGLKDRGLRLQT